MRTSILAPQSAIVSVVFKILLISSIYDCRTGPDSGKSIHCQTYDCHDCPPLSISVPIIYHAQYILLPDRIDFLYNFKFKSSIFSLIQVCVKKQLVMSASTTSSNCVPDQNSGPSKEELANELYDLYLLKKEVEEEKERIKKKWRPILDIDGLLEEAFSVFPRIPTTAANDCCHVEQ